MKEHVWHLRLRMAERGIFQTTELVPLLAERGVHLSREQVYRLVTQQPERYSGRTIAALCDILECDIQDLIEIRDVETVAPRKSAGAAKPAVRKTTIRRPQGL